MRLLAICILMLGAACGTTVTTRQLNTAPGSRSPRPASEVELYTTSKPPYQYIELAVIEARESSKFAVEDPFNGLREQAGEMGCDGLIVLGSADEVQGSVVTNSVTGTSGSVSTLHGYRGTCIVRTSKADDASKAEAMVSVDGAAVHTAPSDTAPELAKLPTGALLAKAEAPERDWRRVQLEDGRWGYVRDLYIKVGPYVRVGAATPAAAAPVAAVEAPAAPAPSAPGTCEPICSPGYACQAGVCVALCNPRCAPDETCGGDRICRKR